MTDPAADPELIRFNRLSPAETRAALLACCAVPWWAAEMEAARPYGDRAELFDKADAALRRLDDDDVAQALSAHPRIGERPSGGSTEAGWSRREQSGVARDDETLSDLHAVNKAYEHRFGRVFLICATGLSSGQILTAARARLGNDDDTERRVVAEELRKIALVRLETMLDDR